MKKEEFIELGLSEEAAESAANALAKALRERDEEHAAQLRRVRIDADVRSALLEARARNGRAVRALLDLEDAELDEDGRVKGLREQLAQLARAEDSRFLFASAAPRMKGARIGEDGSEEGGRGADTAKMTYDELCAYLEDNPQAKL